MSIFGELQQLCRRRIVQTTALAAVFAILMAFCIASKSYLLDPDIWWHLKVGDWIIQHRAVPLVGIFSRTASARPWVAYSWGFEVILSVVYSLLGLLGFAWFGVVLSLLVSVVLFAASFTLSRRFWRSWFFTGFGSFAFIYSLYPRPVFCSMILFTVLLCMILKAQNTGRIQILYWLPLLFLVWANLHIQFVYGLATLALYIVVDDALRFLSRLHLNVSTFRAPTLSPGKLSAIFLASLAASCIGPYSYQLFVVIAKYSRATQTYSVIGELQAPPFNNIPMFVFLFVLMAGFYAVGWRRQIDAFQLCLLVVASLCAFRTVRDAWFATIPAVLFIAEFPADRAHQDSEFRPISICALTGATAILALLLAANMGFNSHELDRSISRNYPVDAANFVRKIHPAGSLYNDFDWGGFLIWYLPDYAVSVDGRNDLYGDAFVAGYIQFSQGDHTDGDPELDDSGVVMLWKELSLAKLLKFDPRFQLVYEDRIADVFVRK